MEHLTYETFREKIFDFENEEKFKFKGNRPTVIDFYANWCGPCKMLSPILEELANEYKDRIDIYKIDTDKEQELSQIFGIRSIPSILFIPVDKEPRMQIGLINKDGFKKIFKDLFNI